LLAAACCAEKRKERQGKNEYWQDEGKKAMDKRMRMNRSRHKDLQRLQREMIKSNKA